MEKMTKQAIVKRLKKLVTDYQSSGSSAGHWLFVGVQKLIEKNKSINEKKT